MDRHMELRKRHMPAGSPLSTRELRDCLGRQPLEFYNSSEDTRSLHDDDENSDPHSNNTSQEEICSQNNTGPVSPPQMSKHMTSSPLNTSKSQLPSPHLSIIARDRKAASIEEELSPPITRSRNKSQIEVERSKKDSQGNHHRKEVAFQSRKISKEHKMAPSSRETSFAHKSLEKDPKKCETRNFNQGFVFLMLLGLLVFGWYNFFWPKQEYNQFPLHPSFDERLMREKIQELSNKHFPSQDKDLWKVVQSSLKRIFIRNLTMPACVLLVAPDEQDLTANRLAGELSSLFLTSTFSPNEVVDPLETFKLAQTNDNDAGQELFHYLEKNLREKRIALVHDIGRLNGNVAMNLHPFCDEGSTVISFPKSVVLFTVRNNLDDSSKKKHSAEWLAEKLLNNAWVPAIGVDKAASLISRVAVSVVNVKSEELTH